MAYGDHRADAVDKLLMFLRFLKHANISMTNTDIFKQFPSRMRNERRLCHRINLHLKHLFFRISPKPHILIGHFFAVAVFAVYTTFRAEKWWAAHKATLKSTCIFYKACTVIFPLIWSELKTIIK